MPRTPTRLTLAMTAAVAAALAVACTAEDASEPAAPLTTVAIDDQAGAVCGMIVRDQSAPRAQVVHRDGERAFLCSIGDLLVHVLAPSPHGKAEAIWVEVLTPEQDPAESHTGPHEWVRAEDAVYVVGIERRGIMGPPVLVYRTREDAERVTAGTAGRVLDFEGLKGWWQERGSETPGHQH